MKNVQPTDDLLVVRREGALYAEQALASGIVVPVSDSTVDKKELEVGTIVAVGPGALRRTRAGEWVRTPMDVRAGERVLYGRYAGEHDVWGTTEDPNDYVFIRQNEVEAVLT